MDINEFIKNFSSEFENTDASEFTASTRYHDLDEWDSFLALGIMAKIGEEYGVYLTATDIRSSQTIQDLYDIVNSRL